MFLVSAKFGIPLKELPSVLHPSVQKLKACIMAFVENMYKGRVQNVDYLLKKEPKFCTLSEAKKVVA